MDNSVFIETGIRVENWGIALRFSAGAKNLFLFWNVQTGCGTHPVSYSKDTRNSFIRGKAVIAWIWSLASVSYGDVFAFLRTPYGVETN